jgi:hypothetical protein
MFAKIHLQGLLSTDLAFGNKSEHRGIAGGGFSGAGKTAYSTKKASEPVMRIQAQVKLEFPGSISSHEEDASRWLHGQIETQIAGGAQRKARPLPLAPSRQN